jgi:hypothetical protein
VFGLVLCGLIWGFLFYFYYYFMGCYSVFLLGFGILILVGFVVLFLWVDFGCSYVYFLCT